MTKKINALVLVSVLLLMVVACKKYNQIDNGSTIKTPYSLFIGGYNGIVKKTNDALYFPSLFYTDNSTVRSIVVADSVVCYIKEGFYYSKDDGAFFQQSFKDVITPKDSFWKYYIPNIALFDDAKNSSSTRNIYVCGKDGLYFSGDLGKTFTKDNNWTAPAIVSTSITQLSNGELFTKANDSTVYTRVNGGGWNIMQIDTPYNLPHAPNWYLAKTHDTLMMIDFDGTQGVYYRTNGSTKWYSCKQLPKTQEILFGNEVFGQFYVGIDSGGLYRMKGNTFEPAGKGLPWNAKVSYMVGKTIRYRTDVTKNYWFCATDLGLYKSTNGADWELIHAGPYSTLR